MESVKRISLSLLAVMAGLSSFAQVYSTDRHTHLLLTDQMGRPVKGATVFINGRRMRHFDTCRFFDARSCYSGARVATGRKVQIRATHPDYFPLSDSIEALSPVQLVRRDRTDFYYEEGRKRYKRYPGYYFTRISNPDSMAVYSTRIVFAGGKVVKSFSVCGPGMKYGEPDADDALICFLPRTAAGDSVLQAMYRNFNTGPIMSHGGPADATTGFAPYFLIQTRQPQRDTVFRVLQALKEQLLINGFGAGDGYHPETIYIRMAQGMEEEMFPLIEKLLQTGLFFDPRTELYRYACPC